MLPLQDVLYPKCYLDEILFIRNVTLYKVYKNEPRRNVTVQKCTVQNVTDRCTVYTSKYFNYMLK